MPHLSRSTAAAILALSMCIAAACGGSKNPVAPTPTTCAFTLSVTNAQVPAAGQTVSIHVDTAASCAWTAQASSGWATLSATSGTGSADVTVTVTPNAATAERSTTVTIAGRDVSIRQAGRGAAPCVYTLESGSSTYGAEGGKGRINVQTAAGCAWTAQSQAPWITLRVSSGNGPGQIEYDVASFAGTAQRSAAILVGDASFTIRQDPPLLAPCTYVVDPTSTVLHWHGSPGDGLEVRLTTAPHCSWTASTAAAWLELLTATAGTGSSVLRVRINSYTQEQSRSAPLMIRWPTETAGQNVSITQEGCYYAISITSDTVAAAGGRRRVSVFGTPVSTTCSIGCPWTAASNASWIHVAGATSRAGDDDLFFDVDVNTTGAPRTGTLTIAGRTLVVSQGI